MVKAMLLQRNINAFVFCCLSVCYVKMANSGTIGQNKHCNNASPVVQPVVLRHRPAGRHSLERKEWRAGMCQRM